MTCLIVLYLIAGAFLGRTYFKGFTTHWTNAASALLWILFWPLLFLTSILMRLNG